ncbi:uncharacterized protein LOC134282356 isoform X2 [Saccostrea cucullata]
MAFSTICLKHLILIMCVPHIHSAILDSEFCEASQSTQTEVVKCPTDELTWSRAAEMKNCSHYNHKCKGQLSYHCVINPWQNATVEVCAPETQINAGHCAEYNLRGGKIQEFYKKTCEDCTNEYISTEAYKYQECYEEVYKIHAKRTRHILKSKGFFDPDSVSQSTHEKVETKQAFANIGRSPEGCYFCVIVVICFVIVHFNYL